MRTSPRLVRAPRRTVILGAAALAILAAGACSEQSAAVRVNDRTVSQAEFMDEVADLHEWVNEAPADGTYDQEFVGSVATERAMFLLLEDVYEDTGRELATEDAELACAQAMQVPPEQAVAGMCEALMSQMGLDDENIPAWYRDRFIDQAVMGAALNQIYSQEELGVIMEGADIEVSSRFGSWDNEALQASGGASGVVAPRGPLIQEDGAEPGPDGLDMDMDMGEVVPEDLPEDVVDDGAPVAP